MTITVNAKGLRALCDFIREYHKRADTILADAGCILAWADEAEQSDANGNLPMVEISRFDCVKGYPVTLTLEPEHYHRELDTA